MVRFGFVVLLVVQLPSATSHGAVVFPPTRNAVDGQLNPWAKGVPFPVIFNSYVGFFFSLSLSLLSFDNAHREGGHIRPKSNRDWISVPRDWNTRERGSWSLRSPKIFIPVLPLPLPLFCELGSSRSLLAHDAPSPHPNVAATVEALGSLAFATPIASFSRAGASAPGTRRQITRSGGCPVWPPRSPLPALPSFCRSVRVFS